MRFLLTGANGFVGRALCRRLLDEGVQVTALGRRAVEISDATGVLAPASHESIDWISAQADFVDLAGSWPSGLRCNVAVHLAARVHQMHESGDVMAAYRQTNVDGALRVAQAAVLAGATRFIFVSSIKAMGEREPAAHSGSAETTRAWRESDVCHPVDPYGVSKFEAEQALTIACQQWGMELVIIRPPLVYGPGVKANFRALMKLTARGWPNPFGAVRARRSMVYIDNLVDAIVTSATHARAPGQIFNVSDGADLTVAQMVTSLAESMGRRARLFPIAPGLLRAAARMAGRQAAADRVLQPLRVDIRHIAEVMNWRPPVCVSEGLHRTAIWYRDEIMTSSSHPHI